MNERIKQLRKHLNMTQDDFSQRLGMARNSVASYEIGRREPTGAIIKSICREFSVNEEWLRTGEGEMFNKPQTFSLDEYAKANGLSALELDIIKTYMELPAKTRQAALAVLRQMFGRTAEEAAIEIEGEAYKEELRAESFTQTASVSPKQKDA